MLGYHLAMHASAWLPSCYGYWCLAAIVKLILCGLYYAATAEPVTTTEPAATPELTATTPAGEDFGP